MRTSFLAMLALALALAVAAAPQGALACGRAEALQPGVVAGDQFVCVTNVGRLVAHDLKQGTRRSFAGARGLFCTIDVADGRACMASQENVLVVDLASGQIVHTLRHADGPVSVGFVDRQHVYAASQQAVEVFSLETGKREHSIELRKPDPKTAEAKPAKPSDQDDGKAATQTADKRAKRGAAEIAWNRQGIVPTCRQGNVLFVALPGGDRAGFYLSELGSVAAVDLEKGRVIEEVKLASGIVGLALADTRLVVRAGYLSYGIPLEHCTSYPLNQGKIDMKSKDIRRYDVSLHNGLEAVSPATAFIDGSDLLVAVGKKIARLSAQGKCVAEKDALGPGRELVGIWNHQALVAENGSLQAVALTPVEQKPTAATSAAGR